MLVQLSEEEELLETPFMSAVAKISKYPSFCLLIPSNRKRVIEQSTGHVQEKIQCLSCLVPLFVVFYKHWWCAIG